MIENNFNNLPTYHDYADSTQTSGNEESYDNIFNYTSYMHPIEDGTYLSCFSKDQRTPRQQYPEVLSDNMQYHQYSFDTPKQQENFFLNGNNNQEDAFSKQSNPCFFYDNHYQSRPAEACINKDPFIESSNYPFTNQPQDYQEPYQAEQQQITQQIQQSGKFFECKGCVSFKTSYLSSFYNHVKTIHLRYKKKDKVKIDYKSFLLNGASPRGRVKGSQKPKTTKKIKKNSTKRPRMYECTCKKTFAQYEGLSTHTRKIHGATTKEEEQFFFSEVRKIGRPQKLQQVTCPIQKKGRGRPRKQQKNTKENNSLS